MSRPGGVRDSLQMTLRLLRRARHHRGLFGLTIGTLLLAGLAETLPIGLATVFVENVLDVDPGSPPTSLGRWIARGGAVLTSTFGVEVDDPRLQSLTLIVVLVIVTGLFTALATWGNTFLGRWIATLVVSDLRREMMSRIVSLPISWFSRRKIGDLVSRFSSDVQVTYMAVNVFLLILVLQPIILLGAVGWALWINWRLAAVSFLLFPPLALSLAGIGRRIKRRSGRSLESFGESLEALNQTLSGLRVIKAFRAEAADLARFERVNASWVRRQRGVIRAKASARAVLDLVYTFTVASVLGFGGTLVVRETWGLDVRTFAGFLVALATMYRPIRRLGIAFGDWQESMAAAARIYEVFDAEPEASDPAGAVRIGPIAQGLRFENVSFSYRGDDDEPARVLHDVSFEVPAGRTVALVGPSGAGKSTIADLIFRFHAPDAGRILVDGRRIETIERSSLLEQMAVVSQHPFLFNATVRENIAFGRPDATDDEIRAAARAAQIEDVILALPNGFETLVGERGETLSGGQRQRLTIARAILRNASFLVLDEATSNLDGESERAVHAALENLLIGRTALIIAHRLSTVEKADLVIVLDSGRVIERGAPADLRCSDGAFARLYQSQLGGTG